ncbi:hypothetical protein F2Q70_00022385 [Brassica cretica]|uniref:Uncharacterized protein n=1 Tax=Brassica cretica TaxID=69181 RepID=A0A8S9GIK1_BRACR|nr:hypothetical protein F2Q70_00022385 [Brassica cretica]
MKVLEISDDFRAFWRYLEQAPEMTIEIDNRYMPSSTRSNKESQLIFSPDPASLERTIRKEAHSILTEHNNSVSLDSAQPPSTQTPVPSTYSRTALWTDNTNLPTTDTLHPTSIDIPSQTSIDTEPRAMVAPLILVRDNNGDLQDHEGHLRNAARQRIDAQGSAIPETDADVEPRTLADYNRLKKTEDPSRRLPSVSTDANKSTSIDTDSPASTDNNNILESVDI